MQRSFSWQACGDKHSFVSGFWKEKNQDKCESVKKENKQWEVRGRRCTDLEKPDKMWGEKKYVFVWYLTISSLTQTKETGQTLLQEKD